jgi:hypothetical protein
MAQNGYLGKKLNWMLYNKIFSLVMAVKLKNPKKNLFFENL